MKKITKIENKKVKKFFRNGQPKNVQNGISWGLFEMKKRDFLVSLHNALNTGFSLKKVAA